MLSFRRLSFVGALSVLAFAAACGRDPLVITRSPCPAIAVLQQAGDVTLFQPPSSREAAAIDVTASITDLRGACTVAGEKLVTPVSFRVVAQRRDATGARTVALPVFAAVMQGGERLLAKQVGQVTLQFADGQARTEAQGSAQVAVSRAAASLPPEINEKITRERKPGDPDAAIDPLADPQVREAVRAATFEVLVGFQLDEAALAYNVTR